MVSYISGRWWRWKFRSFLPIVLLVMCNAKTSVLSCQVECEEVLTASEGIFTSPCYPSDYPPSKVCKWTLQAPAGFVLQLTFLDFELEEAHGCIYDSVSVNTGASSVKFCGLTANGLTLNSSTNVMVVSFISDFSVQKKGFSISYRRVAVALRNQKVTLPQNALEVVRVSSSKSIPQLSEFTACFEISSTSHTGTGTIFFYTTKNSSLSFGHSGNSIVLNINNIKCPIDDLVMFTDFTSEMQPFCLTWSNTNGHVAVNFKGNYKDKICSASIGSSVEPGGSFEMGSEKATGKNFEGIIYNFRLWSSAMTSSALSALTCDAVGNVVDWDNSFWEIPVSYAQTDSSLSCICYPHCLNLTTTISSSGTVLPATTSQTICASHGVSCPASLITTASSLVTTNTIPTNVATNGPTDTKTPVEQAEGDCGKEKLPENSSDMVNTPFPEHWKTSFISLMLTLMWSDKRDEYEDADRAVKATTTAHPPSRPPDAPVGRSSKTSLGFISTPLIWPVRKKPETIVTQTPSHSAVHLTKPPSLPEKSMTTASPMPKLLEELFYAKTTNLTTRRPAYSQVLLSHNRTEVASLSNRKKKPLTAQWGLSESNKSRSETHDYPSDSSSEELFYDIDLDEDDFRLFNFDSTYSSDEGLATDIPLNMSMLEIDSVHTNSSNTTPPNYMSKPVTRQDYSHKSNSSLPWTEVVHIETQRSSMLISDLDVIDVQVKRPGQSTLGEQTTYSPSPSVPLPSSTYKTVTSHLLKPTEVTQGQTVTSAEAYGRNVMLQTTHDSSIAVSDQYLSYQTALFTKWPTVGSFFLITENPTPALPYFSTTKSRLFDDSPRSTPTVLEEHSYYTSLMSATEVQKGYLMKIIRPTPLSHSLVADVFLTFTSKSAESLFAYNSKDNSDLALPLTKNPFIPIKDLTNNNLNYLNTTGLAASYLDNGCTYIASSVVSQTQLDSPHGIEPSIVDRMLETLSIGLNRRKDSSPSEADYWATSHIFDTSIHSSFQMRTERLHKLTMFSSPSHNIYDPSLLLSQAAWQDISTATHRKTNSEQESFTEDKDTFSFPSSSTQFLSTIQNESIFVTKSQDFNGFITPTRTHTLHSKPTSLYIQAKDDASNYINNITAHIQVHNVPDTPTSIGTNYHPINPNSTYFHNRTDVSIKYGMISLFTTTVEHPLTIFQSKFPSKESSPISSSIALLSPVPTLGEHETIDEAMSVLSKPAGGFNYDTIFPSKQSSPLGLEASAHTPILPSYPVDTSISRNHSEHLQDTKYAQFSTTEQPFLVKNESAKPPGNINNMLFVRPADSDRETHPSHPATDDQSFVPVNGTLPPTIPSREAIANLQSLPTGTTYGTTTDPAEFASCPCKAHFHNSCLCGFSAGNKKVFYRISLTVTDDQDITDEAMARWFNQTFQDWNYTVYLLNVSVQPNTDLSSTPNTRHSFKALLMYKHTGGKFLTDTDIENWLRSISATGLVLNNVAVEVIENCQAEENPLHYKWPESRPSVNNLPSSVILPCFPYKEQNASRTCMISTENYTSFWGRPNLENCTDIEDIDISQENAAEVAVQLADITNNELSHVEISKVVHMVQKLVNVVRINATLASTVVTIISNVMISPDSAQLAASERTLKTVDELVQKIEFDGPSLAITSKHLAVGISAINISNFSGANFSAFTALNSSDPQIDFESDIQNPLAVISLPATLLHNVSRAEIETISRIHFMFFSKTGLFQDEPSNGLTLNSYVVASSVGNLTISNLRDPVQIEISHLQYQRNSNRLCVFWDFGLKNGNGGWNSEGCRLGPESSENRTVCLCNHLTHFGVLMDISGAAAQINERNTRILTFITYIGCGLSAIFSAVTLLTYIAFEKLRRDYPSKILMNLCTSLLFLNMVFLLDGWLASYEMQGLCIAVAALLHFFLLTSFTWMGLESIHMYIALVKVFNTYIRRYILKFCIVGWGLPAVIVAIVVAVDKNSYGKEYYGREENSHGLSEFCWIQKRVVFYVTCVAYFSIVFLMNVAMFIVVMMQICGRNGKRSNRTFQEEVLRNLRSVISLTFLLGMTWGFAFFAWGPVSLVFMYLFSIFNSLQGLFIFIFHCALKENVQKQWRRYLCCGKLRLSDNSDWSKTPTNNTKKVSSDNLGKSLSSSSFGSTTAHWTSKAKATLNPFAKHHRSSGKGCSNQSGQKCSASDADASNSSILPVHQVLDKVKGYCSVRSDNFYKNIILSDSFGNTTKF
ncbi:adhesion G-protein coupled receptor G6 [Trichomycterus rosablanca]|uniref:adhesion G-protein coupled receptor G6 n=1 Tax=Trichomycterus rosablanca TaxID=2290929 RepID=UPI002F34F3AD